MDDLLSEKEQIETMRSWWQENGRYIIGGIILGVGILVGWNQWKDYKLVTQLEASVLYETLSNEVSDSKLEAAETVANDLYENYSSTTYAALAKLAMARLYMDKSRTQDAVDTLKALLAINSNPKLHMIGRLRLAKIYLYQAKPQQVIDLLSNFEDSAFAARYNELLGDSHAALGQITEATAAYQRAITEDSMVPTINRAVIQMKIVDLPDEALADKSAMGDAVSAESASDDVAELAVEPESNQ